METLRDEKWADLSGRHGGWARDAALWLGPRVGRSRLIQIADLAGVIDYAAVSQAAFWRTPGQRVKTAPAHGTIKESIVECFDLTLRLLTTRRFDGRLEKESKLRQRMEQLQDRF